MSVLPCIYCKYPTTIKCGACDKHYCNNRGTSSVSHIIFHMIKNKHLSVCINNDLSCYKCDNKNVFDLGFKTSSDLEDFTSSESGNKYFNKYLNKESNKKKNGSDSFNNKLSNGNKEMNDDSSNNSSTEENDEIIGFGFIEDLVCRACCDVKWNPIVKERCFIDEVISSQGAVLRLNKKDLTIIEDDKIQLPMTQPVYTIGEYKDIYLALLTHECEQERRIKENLKLENVKIKFEMKVERRGNKNGMTAENNFYCCFVFPGTVTKILKGDEIIIFNKRVKIKCYVVQNNFSDEIRGRIYKVDGHIEENDLFTIEYVWRSVGKERMTRALSRMEFLDPDILQHILGTKYKTEVVKSTDKTITVISPPGLPILNDSQEEAIKAALSNKITLIQGPPGTGKTVTTAAIVFNLVQKNKGKVLVVANSNAAVDHITEKIYRSGVSVLRIVSKRRESINDDLAFLSLHEKLKALMDDNATKNTEVSFDNPINELNSRNMRGNNGSVKMRRKLSKKIIANTDVITCTNITAGQGILEDFSFPFVLIDEAVQCTEPLSMVPLMHDCIKLVLIGDHKQLGPVILDKMSEQAGFKQTLFERLIKLGEVPHLLNIQYRMHPALSEWPSNTFYNGSLKNGITSISRLNKTPLPFPTFFYVCYGKEEISASATSFLNQCEASYCESIIRTLIKSGVKERQIGVITPYDGQRAFILNKLKDFNLDELEISNVDAFQGREKDFIIVSLVRSNLYQGIGFVSDRRRLNVTLTRAKYGCVIIGNPVTLMKNKTWMNLIEFYQERNLIYEGCIGNLRKVSVTNKSVIDLASLLDDMVLS